MAIVSSVSAPMVEFPSSDSHISLPPSDPRFQRPPHLPFRRISLPSAPNLIQRQSIVSTASFDSLPEEGHVSGAVTPAVTPAVIKSAVRGPRHRPSSGEIPRRYRRSHSQLRPVDLQRESKRRKVINEFHETEKSYVDGLDLIYTLFLTPILVSLDTPAPLLDRNEITSIFSNFIDIWNLHRSFYSSLTLYLNSSSSSVHLSDILPPLSPVLLSHFPYLSLYTPFVTSFPDALSAYASLLASNPAFAVFVSEQEADPRCGKLKLRDWLLTIVQRCPRYLLLIKDLIGFTNPDEPEYASLTAVHTLVSKITMSLNTSLHTHAQTLALLALQRNTANLPFRLITPGRTFLKRAPLLQLEGSTPREREFLLFSDCLIWLASADGDALSGKWDRNSRPALVRTRSKSDADLPQAADAARRRESVLKFKIGPSPKKKVRHASSGLDERWVYKSHVDLVDLEVVVTPAPEAGDEQRFEILSPQRSFAVYASSEEERDDWCMAIRNAKSSLLVSLNVMQPNSTLTSSASTNHLRRQLQALPYSPEEDGRKPKRGKVEHFVPAVWIPDGKTESCMRCGRTFGWRRRRHHCRLCGRCVCGGCSEKTFYVMDPNVKDTHKPARACEACYETVFPLLDPSDVVPDATHGTTHSHFTLSGLKSMPSLAISDSHSKTPPALMAIDVESPKRTSSHDDERSPHESHEPGGVPAIRVKPLARPRSYIQILEDFEEHGYTDDGELPSPSVSRYSHEALDERDEEALEGTAQQSFEIVDSPASAGGSLPPTPRKENTARRHKRFSLPAVALQTSPVTARPSAVGEGISRRFSLMLGRNGSGAESSKGSGGLKDGAAVSKLYELLGRGRRT
ncbi:hypothetical protein OBBRIDRAFT_772455 [Obba rivulosa]|uniref:Uncharacterized protein n=1 Tax=Obba rivulosa TaxID=1052685 RepID=A0A8E2DN21_9APHY|nr:hypothetical protein OBBRIDRAFT_772455 [Obba rivulosa]